MHIVIWRNTFCNSCKSFSMQRYDGGREALWEGKHQQSWMVGKHSDEADAAGPKFAILKLSYILDKYIFEFGQIHFTIWTNIFLNWDKYIFELGQIHLTIWTTNLANILLPQGCNFKTLLPQDFLQLRQIYFPIWTNTFHNLDKYILQVGQIHFTNILMSPMLPNCCNFKNALT